MYDTLLGFYATPVGILMEWLLGAAVLYHALNGLRIVIMDFWPSMTRYHRELWYVNWVLFVAHRPARDLRHLRPVRALDGVVGMSVRVGRSGRLRPQGDRRELAIWTLMRLTGLALFVLVLSHYIILHVFHDPADQTADWIGQFRWNSTFWRVYDWTMLTLVLFHAFAGMRIVVGDVLAGRARTIVMWVLYALAVMLFVMGTHVVLTLPNVVPA